MFVESGGKCNCWPSTHLTGPQPAGAGLFWRAGANARPWLGELVRSSPLDSTSLEEGEGDSHPAKRAAAWGPQEGAATLSLVFTMRVPSPPELGIHRRRA